MCPLRVREILPEEMAFGLGHWREQEFPGQSGSGGTLQAEETAGAKSWTSESLVFGEPQRTLYVCGFRAGGTDWGTGSLGIRPRGLGFISVGVFLEI